MRYGRVASTENSHNEPTENLATAGTVDHTRPESTWEASSQGAETRRQQRTQDPKHASAGGRTEVGGERRGPVAHPKFSCRSSLSIGIGVACGIALCASLHSCGPERGGRRARFGKRWRMESCAAGGVWELQAGVPSITVDEYHPGLP